MAKFFTNQTLREQHTKLRSLVNDISRQTASIRKQAKQARETTEQTYQKAGLSKTALRNAINNHINATIGEKARAVRNDLTPKLREIEGIRQRLGEARGYMDNPIRYINAVTLTNEKFIGRRLATMQMLNGAGNAALETAALAAKATGDIGALAAIISINDKIKASNRIFSNAELVAEIEIPGFRETEAILSEVETLAEYSKACERSFDHLGDMSGVDKISNALAERRIEVNDDGSLVGFKVTEPSNREKTDIIPTKPNPKAFDTWDEFCAAGGDWDDLSNSDMVRFWPADTATAGDGS